MTVVVCPEPGCTYTEARKEWENPTPKERVFKTTRSGASDDAHRDFDGFDIDEELARARLAMIQFVAEAFNNIDEWLIRMGRLPKAWGHAKPPVY